MNLIFKMLNKTKHPRVGTFLANMPLEVMGAETGFQIAAPMDMGSQRKPLDGFRI